MKKLSALTRNQAQKAAWKRSAYEVQLVRDWADIIAKPVHNWARPGRLWLPSKGSADGQAARLELEVQQAFTLEVQQSVPLIQQKINLYFGFPLVGQIQIKQTRRRFPSLVPTRKREESREGQPLDISQLPGDPPDDAEMTQRLMRLQQLVRARSES